MSFFEELINFFEDLSTQPDVGGLHITNSSVQYVSFQYGQDNPIHYSVKLPPGVVEDGRIKDAQKLVEALRKLHTMITENNPKDRIKVVVGLPSNVAFTQNFNIPNVGKSRLDESAELNLQMVSPIQAEDAYMSWQLISETKDKYGILGAFSNKAVVDEFKSALLASNFHPIAVEFPSLSLSWTVNRIIGPRDESMLILNVSSNGIDIFLLRNGYIYFDYFKSWNSIQAGSSEISEELFNQSLLEEVRKVVNFTSSHFDESLRYAFFVAPGLENKIKNIIENNFQIQAYPLQSKFGDLGPAWYSVIGSAIRASWSREKDRFISIGTAKVEEVFYREQSIDFIKRWRNIFAGVVVIFLLLFVGAAALLRVQPNILEQRLSEFNVQAQRVELEELESEAERFNNIVGSIEDVRTGSGSIPMFIDEIRSIGEDYNIRMNQINIPSLDSSIQVSARGPDSNTVVRFKNELTENPKFTNIDLPFSEITTTDGNFVTFNMSFSYNPDPEAESN